MIKSVVLQTIHGFRCIASKLTAEVIKICVKIVCLDILAVTRLQHIPHVTICRVKPTTPEGKNVIVMTTYDNHTVTDP